MATHRKYEIINGELSDLAYLPLMQNPPPKASDCKLSVDPGSRNNALFRDCMQEAGYCDNFDALLDVALTCNASWDMPLPDAEAAKVAQSAWGIQSGAKTTSAAEEL